MCRLDIVTLLLLLPFQIGRTEQVKNTENPEFATPILVDYFFEEVQKLKISIYDVDSCHSSLDGADSLGSIECNLGQVLSPYVIMYLKI